MAAASTPKQTMSEPYSTDCEAVELYLLGDHDESAGRIAALEEHLEGCAKCQATAKAWRSAVEAYHELDQEDVSPAIAATVLAAAQAKRERSAWHIAGVAAALVLVFATFALHSLGKIQDAKWAEGQVAEAQQLIKLGKPDQALGVLEAAHGKGLSSKHLPLLAELQLKNGQAQAALDTIAELWDQSAELADTLEVALLNSQALAELGQRDAALAVLDQARAHFQSDAEAEAIDQYAEALGGGVPTDAQLEELSGLGYL